MKVCVVGAGYVGLVVASCLAGMGNSVICVEKDQNKLEMLKNGIIPIYEPELEELIKTNMQEKRLIFTENLDYAVKESLVCFVAVGTPQDEDGSADLVHVIEVTRDIAKSMNGYKVIVEKSTVPVGTSEKLKNIIKNHTDQPFDIVSNPEFLKQGNAVNDYSHPDRIIIGSDSEKAIKIMKELYSSFLRLSTNKIVVMDLKSAELTKYAANAFLATKISFMNEISNLCEKVGANVENVRVGLSMDSRIGNKFLFAGVGYGGSCFPKDIKALIKTGQENDCQMSIVQAVNKVNIKQRLTFFDKILKYYKNDLADKTIAVWGLAFKPKTNDMREAPSVTIINRLLECGAKVKAYDPKAIDTAKIYFGDKIIYATDSYEALKNTDALLLLTEWNEFRHPDFERMKDLMNVPVIFDGRNQYDKTLLNELGFEYYCIGK